MGLPGPPRCVSRGPCRDGGGAYAHAGKPRSGQPSHRAEQDTPVAGAVRRAIAGGRALLSRQRVSWRWQAHRHCPLAPWGRRLSGCGGVPTYTVVSVTERQSAVARDCTLLAAAPAASGAIPQRLFDPLAALKRSIRHSLCDFPTMRHRLHSLLTHCPRRLKIRQT